MEQSIKLASTIENLSIVENMVEDISTKNIIDEEMLGNVMVCVTEAVTNAIEHGNLEISYDEKLQALKN